MTIVFADSGAHVSAAQILRKYEVGQSVSAIVAGRFPGSSALRLNGSSPFLYKTVPARTTYGMGFGFTRQAISDSPIAGVLDTGTAQVSLGLLNDGRLGVCRGGWGGALLGSSSVALKANAWYYLELKVLVDPAAGTVRVRLNGTTVIDLAGVNTRNTGVSQITQVGFSAVNNSTIQDYTDIYVLNTLGAVNNDLLGDCRVPCLLPTGAGAYTEFTTLFGAATQWQATADNPADDDVSYIASATPGQRSTFAFADLPAGLSGTVAAVIVNHESRKDDAGSRTIAGMVRLAAVDAAGAGTSKGNNYTVDQEIFETDPSAAAWTVGNVNAAEYGMKEIA